MVNCRRYTKDAYGIRAGEMKDEGKEIKQNKTAITHTNYFAVDPSVPGIRALMDFKPQTGRALSALAEALLRGESSLSRGERERLTELLVGIPRDVTLVLIEHDMDVALNVAEYVTMMHDGQKIVEGTPAEIRANQVVHDLYLGSGHYE